MDELDNVPTVFPPSKLKSAILLGDFNVNLLSNQPLPNPPHSALQDLTCKLDKYGNTRTRGRNKLFHINT